MRFTAALIAGIAGMAGCDRSGEPATMAIVPGLVGSPATKPSTDQLAAYKAKLSAESYRVLFEADTEPPFQNAYHDNHAEGTYVSAATGVPLFSSDDKYDSGTGWPSFTKPIIEGSVVLKTDPDGDRVEVIDASSGGHLGHVFDDGPTERGGKRYCMNSAAMVFVPKGEKLPATTPAK